MPDKCRILVVEDEAMVSMLIEDILVDLGYVVSGTAGRLGQALEMLDTVQSDGALLDVNLDGTPSYPLAEALARRKVPFVFVTGYGEAGVDERYRGHPVLQKPFTRDRLQAMLERALGT